VHEVCSHEDSDVHQGNNSVANSGDNVSGNGGRDKGKSHNTHDRRLPLGSVAGDIADAIDSNIGDGTTADHNDNGEDATAVDRDVSQKPFWDPDISLADSYTDSDGYGGLPLLRVQSLVDESNFRSNYDEEARPQGGTVLWAEVGNCAHAHSHIHAHIHTHT
jgi:hypothetical protein